MPMREEAKWIADPPPAEEAARPLEEADASVCLVHDLTVLLRKSNACNVFTTRGRRLLTCRGRGLRPSPYPLQQV